MKESRKGCIVYHDPCYLGRYQQISNEPRNLLKNIAGAQLVEMKRAKERSHCCGAGGGYMWLDDVEGAELVSSNRVEEALQTGAQTIVTACPFCLSMLAESPPLRSRGDVQVIDVIELVVKANH